MNVALYGKGVRRWTMTERGAGDLCQEQASLRIGSSQLEADNGRLIFRIEEQTALVGSRVSGTITVEPETLTEFRSVLDAKGRHSWFPVAPLVHVQVDFDRPALSWRGSGYLDMNRGSEPLEDGFRHWNWSRAGLKNESAILYGLDRRSGAPLELCLRIAADGTVEAAELASASKLPGTPMWLMPRRTRCDEGAKARVMRTLEDTPFYSRSMISTRIFGQSAVAMHESLSLNRFRTGLVQTLLPYRMPRAAGGGGAPPG